MRVYYRSTCKEC